jgi:hypothetical protein
VAAMGVIGKCSDKGLDPYLLSLYRSRRRHFSYYE